MPKAKLNAKDAVKSPMLDVARDLYISLQYDDAKRTLDECGASPKRARMVRARAVKALMVESRVMEATMVATHDEGYYAWDHAGEMLAETVPLGSLAHVGDILHASWGYDQTNADFYQVVKVSASNVWIREIRKTVVGDQGGSTEMVMPISGAFATPYSDHDDKATRSPAGAMHRIQVSSRGTGYMVRIASYAHARLWDGKPCHQTGWGYGH